ncbi:unnamed protein product [Triticum turgidum subsp. durum]|uniref:Secreted protein n=1 Tax=Triticum turgidum subsp. durum TaxID=4567 RepID=A0A9R0U475_TRITD|nr:unnamed protein product [Triticum turgidum subsp. durum]
MIVPMSRRVIIPSLILISVDLAIHSPSASHFRAADSQDCSHRAGWSLGAGFPGHLLAVRQKPGQEEGRLLTWKHGGREGGAR